MLSLQDHVASFFIQRTRMQSVEEKELKVQIPRKNLRGVVNQIVLSLCDSKRQYWTHLVNVKWLRGSPAVMSWVGGELSSSREDLLCRECVLLTTTRQDVPGFIAPVAHFSSLCFASCPALVRGKAGVQKGCVRVCVCGVGVNWTQAYAFSILNAKSRPQIFFYTDVVYIPQG